MASDIVRRAMAAGASDAECTIAEGAEFSANVRMREIEQLKEAGSRAAGLRILIGRKTGASYTSDLSREGIELMVRSAIELADLTSEDPHAGMPDDDELGAIPGDLGLYSAETEGLEPGIKDRRSQARGSGRARCRPAHRQLRRRLFRRLRRPPHLRQLARIRRRVPFELLRHQRRPRGARRRIDGARSLEPLRAPLRRPRIARAHRPHGRAQRALRRLNPVKVETQKVPVVFEPGMARTLLDSVCDAVHGMSVYRNESFLAGRLGEKVAAETVTIVDDGTLPGLFGSSPFDDEGVRSRRTPVIERGVLKSYLLNSYAARKLGMKTTGNASRGITGNAGIGHGNFYLEKGVQTPEEMIAGIANGFFVTELMGFGVNIVTGDYSRGASGLWIRNGELAFAVSEVTIAGNLKDMLMGIETIGSDLEFRGSTAAPTIKIGEMTVAGK